MTYLLKRSAFVAVLFSLWAITACQTVKPSSTSSNTEAMHKKTASGKEILYGPSTQKDLQQTPFSTWFEPAFNTYKPDQTTLAPIKEKLAQVKVKAFMGTWCSDSRREVPRFYKIVDQYNMQVELHNLDTQKKGPNNIEQQYNITKVPTFIFYDHTGKELGRIIEAPTQSLEKDIAKILQ